MWWTVGMFLGCSAMEDCPVRERGPGGGGDLRPPVPGQTLRYSGVLAEPRVEAGPRRRGLA